MFVNDSFLRDCQVGALVNGSATSARPRLVLDNTRIERGTGVNTDVGVIATNNVDLSIRNSVISSVGYGLRFENTLSGVHPIATLLNTSLHGVNNAIVMTNSGDGQPVEPRDHRLRVREPDVRDRRVTATNAGSALVYLTDSKVSRYTTGIKTGGAAGSWVQVFLLRSQLQQGNAALEHHLGRVVLNASHVVWNSNSLVDADSNDVRSLNNNMIFQNADSTAGTTYITTPALISTK